MYVLIAISVILVAGFIFLMARLARTMGQECVFCGGRALMLDYLPENERKQVLRYFVNVEDRVPFAEHVWVCKDCHRVDDDKVSSNTALGLGVRCKVCGVAFMLDDSMTCPACGVRYKWTTFAECGDHQFLLPDRSDSPEVTGK